MTINTDADGIEVSAIKSIVDFKGQNVLEIGCGDGRFTWLYAENAESVTGVDPNREDIEKAKALIPETLEGRIHFLPMSLMDFALSIVDTRYDIAIFSWSL
jgi:cyclopropane fatty-acyl-phospholipid synthase-like methyltransferase